MALAASTIFSNVRALLDDDNSSRYTDAKDLIPAMNVAISYLMTVFNAAFEQKKVQPEVLAELISVMILDPEVTGNTARVDLNSHENFTPYSEAVWTIFGVDPTPTYDAADDGGGGTIDQLSETTLRFAKKLTLEEWNYAQEDPFAPGTTQTIPSDFQRVCYTGPGKFFYMGEDAGGDEDTNIYILIRPGSLFSVNTTRVGIWFLRRHPVITLNSDLVLFPVTVHNFITQKMIQYISYQHGNDKYFKMTDKEVKEIIALING